MNFELITGPAMTFVCQACQSHVTGGTEPYVSASQGGPVTPGNVYIDTDGRTYCEDCAAKLSVEDPTRSVTQFYTDTKGEEIDHKRLPD